jgi:hypothetical protein
MKILIYPGRILQNIVKRYFIKSKACLRKIRKEMPRTNSSTSTKPNSGFFSHHRQSPLAPPIPPSPNPPVTQTVQVQQPGLFSNMWQGFGFGAGSSIAHNMFDKDKTVIHKEEPPKYTGPCAKEKIIFDKCIEHRQTLEECERTLKDLHACYDQTGSNPMK